MDRRINSIWLDEWRSFADEASGLSAKQFRTLMAAINAQEQVWTQRHEEAYGRHVKRNRTTRDEKVVAPYEGMAARLKDMRAKLEDGLIDPKTVRGEIRTMQGRDPQLRALHDTLEQEDAGLARLAAMTPGDFQRHMLATFPALNMPNIQPTLDAMCQRVTPPPPPGGESGWVDSPNPLLNGVDPDDLARERAANGQ